MPAEDDKPKRKRPRSRKRRDPKEESAWLASDEPVAIIENNTATWHCAGPLGAPHDLAEVLLQYIVRSPVIDLAHGNCPVCSKRFVSLLKAEKP